MREHLQAVVDLAYKQKPTASIEEVVRRPNHLAQHDDFLDLRQSAPARSRVIRIASLISSAPPAALICGNFNKLLGIA